MNAMMAELCGKTGGCNKGKGGMFSMMSPGHHHWGCYPIVAAQTPLALGFGFAMKYRGGDRVAFCLMGEGAMNQGVFHETLKLAGLFNIPVVYVVENNNYAMGTSVERSSAFKDHLAKRAEAYDLDWDVVDGWDFQALRSKLLESRERAAKESKGTILEVKTYRFYGFHIADANHKKYRSPEEIDYHKEHRDPIKLWGDQLRLEGLLDDKLEGAIHREAKQEAMASVGYAAMSAKPRREDLTEGVYWEVDHESESSQQGRHFFNDEDFSRKPPMRPS
jgi:pyruvate dehydrogenase E1 component alpha subunit